MFVFVQLLIMLYFANNAIVKQSWRDFAKVNINPAVIWCRWDGAAKMRQCAPKYCNLHLKTEERVVFENCSGIFV